jgi:hypothetical protein
MKSLQIMRVDSNDGDTHYVFLDVQPSEKNIFAQDYNETEVMKASKKRSIKTYFSNTGGIKER